MVSRIASTSGNVNLSKLSMLLANNVVCRVAFGKKYGDRFDAVMHETQVLLGEFLVSDYFPWMRWLNKFNGVEARVEKCFNELDKLYDDVIEDHLVPTRSTLDNEDIVDVLLRLQKDPSQLISLNNQQIKGILTDVFLAGTDTTASILIWIFTELIRNPPCNEFGHDQLPFCDGRFVQGSASKAKNNPSLETSPVKFKCGGGSHDHDVVKKIITI
ncbi:hypothetical protein V6N13_123347 [Hibiscus sabdariffa]